VDLGEHEISGLIRLIEKISAVYLQGCEGAEVLRAMTLNALGLGGAVESLRIGSEKQHCGIAGFSAVEEIEMGKQGFGGCVRLERKAAVYQPI